MRADSNGATLDGVDDPALGASTAYDRASWGHAYASLSEIEASELGPDGLHRLGMAAYLTGRDYMNHCHFLRHEDRGMMGQFTVVEADDIDTAPRSIDAHNDHE